MMIVRLLAALALAISLGAHAQRGSEIGSCSSGSFVSEINLNAAPSCRTMVASGQALTKVDDTNFTLTLGGSPTVALLAPVSITAGWAGTLATSRGGTSANLSAGASGGIPFFNALGVMGASALLPATQVMLGGGAGVAPNSSANATFDGASLSIGGSAAQAPLHVKASSGKGMVLEDDNTATFGPVFYITAPGQTTSGTNASEFLFMVAGPGSSSVGEGPLFIMRGNTFTRSASQRGRLSFAAGNITSAPAGSDGNIEFWVGAATTALQLIWQRGGSLSVGAGASPTGHVHIKAGTAAAGTGPLKFSSGTLMTTAEAMAVEALTDNLHFTITTGAARKGVMLDDGARLTSGLIPTATTNGRLIDGPTPVADATYPVECTTPGNVSSFTTVKGLITAVATC